METREANIKAQAMMNGTVSSNNLELMIGDSNFFNELLLPNILYDGMPHVVQSYLRNVFCGVFVFLGTCVLNVSFWKIYSAAPKGSVVSVGGMLYQLRESFTLLPFCALFLASTEHLTETGWTRCYSKISSVGVPAYLFHLVCYLIVVEVLTYAIHRWMHEAKVVYKYIHRQHHHYNKEAGLSPFAGWALNPLDGMLMQLPQFIASLTLPTHYTTHLIMCLVEAMWGVMVHSRSNGLPWPFMDAKFHNLHHTSGHHNYGNFTIWIDRWCGTLRQPVETVDKKK